MAKRKPAIWAMDLNSGKEVNTNPLKPNDVEPWSVTDNKKAQELLVHHFPKVSSDTSTIQIMRNMLVKEIGQDLMAVDKAISQYLEEHKAKEISISVDTMDTQLEAWKATPADQAMRELAQLSRNQGMEPAEKRIELEIIRTKADIMGALVPQQATGNNIVAIKFVMPENTQMKPVVDVQCR